ncbi:MAG TPA: hypothetical protein VKB57_13295, partial [Acidimicrobiales bacterium]|nr:hypothetical protein [Acidimicrobiales bacterium]
MTPGWASLPPLTTTTTAPASTFKIGGAVKEDLVALDSPRLSHGMGHLVSGDGPPGVIDGLASVGVQRRVDPALGGGLDMPLAPLADDPGPAAGGDGGVATWSTPAFTPPVVSGSWSAPASPLAAPAPEAPGRALPVVLTAPAAPAVQRSIDGPPAPASSPAPSPTPASAPAAAESAPGAPGPQAAPLAMPVVPAPTPAGDEAPTVSRRVDDGAPAPAAPAVGEPVELPAPAPAADAPAGDGGFRPR